MEKWFRAESSNNLVLWKNHHELTYYRILKLRTAKDGFITLNNYKCSRKPIY
jgi:hypothetical protein